MDLSIQTAPFQNPIARIRMAEYMGLALTGFDAFNVREEAAE
jgi:hypothetical protein